MEPLNPISAELAALKTEFSLWRASKSKQKGGRSIPAHLWAGVIQVAQKESIGRISRTLVLDSKYIKRRVENKKEVRVKNPFIEIPFSEPALQPNTLLFEVQTGMKTVRVYSRMSQALNPEKLFLLALQTK